MEAPVSIDQLKANAKPKTKILSKCDSADPSLRFDFELRAGRGAA